jgi:hypothetical protein
MKDSSSRAVVTPDCLPTDSLAYVYMSTGMRRRLGDESMPSLALLQRHVRWRDNFLNDAYTNSADPEHRAELARAAIANLAAWLGWLRVMEVFSLRWIDVTVTEPGDGAALDLPPAIGAVSCRLLPQTKSDQSCTADILLAYTTSSSFSIGHWLNRLRVSLGAVELPSDVSLIFQESDGTPWSSLYFRATYLVPLLEMQRRAGDTHLTPFDGSPGNSIADKFWSMSSYRRGGRSHVSRVRAGCIRKAFPTHNAIIRYESLTPSIREDAVLFWAKRIAPPLVYGSKFTILFQMTMIPLTMSRFSIASLSRTVFDRFIPLNRAMRIRVHLGSSMICLVLFPTLALVTFY